MLERIGRRLVSSVLIWEVVITLLCLHMAPKLRLRLVFGNALSAEQAHIPWQLYVAVAFIWTMSFLLLTPQRALFSRNLVEAIGRLLGSVALASLTFAGLLYLSVRDISRLQFLYFAVCDLAALLVVHLCARSYIRLRNLSGGQRRVLLVGCGPVGQQLAAEFARRPWTGIRILGCTSDEAVDGITVLGPINATLQIVLDNKVNEVIFVIHQQDRIAELSLQLLQYPVMLHTVAGVLDLTFARSLVEMLGGVPLISLKESALTESQRMLKRFFDITASTILLLLLSPLMVVIAVLVKIDSRGPVFFQQERIGEHNQHFMMIKFRSMYKDAEQRWREVALRDEQGHLVHKSSGDWRITPIGQKLRRTSLDELPQLINVLRGEMSLVGPRPEMPLIAAEYQPWQWQRFRVPPGMTGWWQVNGRSGRPMHLHTEDDLYYIHNYSFWLDLKILWMTVWVVITGHGAF